MSEIKTDIVVFTLHVQTDIVNADDAEKLEEYLRNGYFVDSASPLSNGTRSAIVYVLIRYNDEEEEDAAEREAEKQNEIEEGLVDDSTSDETVSEKLAEEAAVASN